ncbi:uncharacterized protein EKO05_0005991 [Ascochyta rabiei]|uniref:NmrA-like domain-containing protein n=1 Tax=Didymella rabiei TaxID=5454 RepID=A0A163MAA9_DIDRA|nr:uncharacterized protein EKO05_0005991 [Ascochyta rabiei]KZM28537.1 hypothetical protein ST47_g357 [Ascochyta rabiei]UPX15547.1 hypothetical protein EKO05_0005991 [Ascochyta rabiei]
MTTATPTQEQTQILLLGAGELGLALLPHLSSLPNTHVTIGVRSPEKYTHLATPTISLTTVDLTSPSPILIPVFSSYDILISATGFTSSPGSVTKLAHEVLEAGQSRKQQGKGRLWYFPWQWGVDYDITGDGNGLMPLFGEQKRVRDLLRKEAQGSGVKWTVVSTGIFMSFLFEPFWGIVDRSQEGHGGEAEKVVVRCLRDWSHRVTVTDVADIGRVVQRILAGDVDAENRVLFVGGATISYGQLAEVVGRVAGCKVVREAWSLEGLKEELRKDPENGIKKYRLVFAGEGVSWAGQATVNHELGMEMMDAETCAKGVFGVQQ